MDYLDFLSGIVILGIQVIYSESHVRIKKQLYVLALHITHNRMGIRKDAIEQSNKAYALLFIPNTLIGCLAYLLQSLLIIILCIAALVTPLLLLIMDSIHVHLTILLILAYER